MYSYRETVPLAGSPQGRFCYLSAIRRANLLAHFQDQEGPRLQAVGGPREIIRGAVVRTTIQRCFQSCDTWILVEGFPSNCLETICVSLASALTQFVVSLSSHVFFAS